MPLAHWINLSISAIRATTARQSVLLANAGAITLGNLTTALLGFVYWWFAARYFSPREVGFAAGAVSIMNLLAQIGEFGMGPLLMSELPGRTKPGAFVSAALAATLVSGLTLGVGFWIGGELLSINLGRILDTSLGDGAFLLGVLVSGFTVVLDQAFFGLLISGFQLIRTMSFAGIKLLLLIGVAFATHGSTREVAIFDTWVAGQLLSLVVLAVVCARAGHKLWHPPRVALLRPMTGKVLGHHALNVAIQAPMLIMPFIVTVLLSPQVNAAFYAAWTLVNVVLLVPASLSSVMVTVARREPWLLGRRLSFSLALSSAVAVGASLACLALSTFVLGLFSPRYPSIAGTSLALLGFGTIGMTVKYHYIAVERFTHRMVRAAALLALGGVIEVGASIFGAYRGDLEGFTLGWLIAITVEAVFMIPTMISAIRAGRQDCPKEARTGLELAYTQAEGAQANASV
jgi:O-antigen/teichoic acid export membrane protein